MFKRIVSWYREWEQEQMAVLLDPSLAQKIEPGYRRRGAMHLAAMSELDRRQLYETSLRWSGTRFMKTALVAMVGFAVLGGVVHLIRPQIPLGASIALSMTFGSVLLSSGLIMWFYYRLFMQNKFKLMGGFSVMTVSGVLSGVSARAVKDGKPLMEVLVQDGPGAVGATLSVCAVLLLVMLVVSAMRSAGFEKVAATLQAEAARERLARQLSETQLRLLHAQIEPHFLFNTLGAVQQLAERDHARAAAELTANLIAFLRSTAVGMAQEMVTLRDEFELARAYLHVMKVRLGARLEVAIDLPAHLACEQVPGMSVLTLAENAIKHGVEPSSQLTRVTLWAERDGESLRVRVADNGAGLRESTSGGMGLQNVRDRLRLAFGPEAALALFEQDSGGVVAEMTMPVKTLTRVAA